MAALPRSASVPNPARSFSLDGGEGYPAVLVMSHPSMQALATSIVQTASARVTQLALNEVYRLLCRRGVTCENKKKLLSR